MPDTELLHRVEQLEEEVRQIKAQLPFRPKKSKDWWREVAGMFKDDPLFEKAVEYSREWRRSLPLPEDEIEDMADDAPTES